MPPRQRLPVIPWLPLLTILAYPIPAAAQVRVTAIAGPGERALQETGDVAVVLWGSFEELPLRVGQELAEGDELTARHDRLTVQLACSDTAVLILAGRFRVAVGAGGEPCVVDLRAGEVHVLGDSTTGARLGGVTMGAKRTHYVVRAGRGPSGPLRQLTVYEGEVEIRGQGRRSVVGAGNQLPLVRARTPEPIPERVIAHDASLYARIDVSRARSLGEPRQVVYDRLFGAHRAVLEQAADPARRMNLVAEQVRVQAASGATLYQLAQVERLVPGNADLQAAAALLAAGTYTQLGEPARAAERYRQAERQDPERVAAALRAYQVEPALVGAIMARPAAVPDTLRVRAVAEPAAVAPGQPTRIIVYVTNRAGAPVQGVTVKVSAGGGEFRGASGLEAAGVTDAQGVHAVSWRCGSCAPGYGMRVVVEKKGWAGAETGVSINIG